MNVNAPWAPGINEGTMIVVHCYAGERERIKTLLPLWQHHERLILFVSPEDAPMRLHEEPWTLSGGDNGTGYYCRSAGGNGWIGKHVPYRLIAHWKIALEYGAKWYFINEWDSFCLSPKLPEELYEDEDKFWSIEVNETWATTVNSGLRFSFPYFVSHKLLRKMVDRAEEILPDITEGPDLDLYGNYSPDGFTVHLWRDMQFEHGAIPNGRDSREENREGRPIDRIVHWHALKDHELALPLLAREQWRNA